ncbi:MAG: hypothetical protein RIT45_920 [Pseudomonadota bacterium]
MSQEPPFELPPAAAQERHPVTPPRPRRRWLRRLAIACLLGAIGAIGVGAWLAGHLAHPLVQGRVAALAQDLAGATLRYESGAVSASGLVLRGLRIENPPADDARVGPLLAVDEVEIRWRLGALLEQTRRVDAITVRGVHIGVVVGGEGGGSWARALTLPPPSEPSPPVPPSGWLRALDAARGYALDALSVQGISVRAALAGTDARLTIDGGGIRLRADGDAETVATMTTDGAPWQVRIDGLPRTWLLDRVAEALASRPDALPPELQPWVDDAVGLADAWTRAVAAAPADAATAEARATPTLRLELARDRVRLQAGVRSPSLRWLGGARGCIGAEDFAAVRVEVHVGGPGASVTVEGGRVTLSTEEPSREARFSLRGAVDDPSTAGAPLRPRLEALTLAARWPGLFTATASGAAREISAVALAADLTATVALDAVDVRAPTARLAVTHAKATLQAHGLGDRLVVGLRAETRDLDAAARGVTARVRDATVAVDAAAGWPSLKPEPGATVALRARELAGAVGDARATLESPRLDARWAGGLAGRIDAGVERASGRAAGASAEVRAASLQAEGDPARQRLEVAAESLDADFGGEAIALSEAKAELSAAGVRRGADGSWRCDEAHARGDVAQLRVGRHALPGTARAELDLRGLAARAGADPTAVRAFELDRLTLRATGPGMDAALTARRPADAPLRWDGRLGVRDPLQLAATVGVRLPRDGAVVVRKLSHVGVESRGSLALPHAKPADDWARWLLAARAEHESALQLDGYELRMQQRVVSGQRLRSTMSGTVRATGLNATIVLLPEGLRVDGARTPATRAQAEVEVALADQRLRSATLRARLDLDGKTRGEASLAVRRGDGWQLEGSGKVRKLGKLGAALAAGVPCIDGERLHGEGTLAIRLPLAALDRPATLAAWADRPAAADVRAEGKATVYGLRCHQEGLDVAAPQVDGGMQLSVSQGRFEATFEGAMLRMRGAFGAHPFDLRKAGGTLRVKGPLDRSLRGLELQGEAKLERLDQDLMPALPVADARATVRAHVDRVGKLALERATFSNEATGSSGWARGRIDRIGLSDDDDGGVPGARGAAVDGELRQDLDRLPELFGVRTQGVVRLPFAIETGDFRVLGVQARAHLEGVGARHAATDAEIVGVQGEIPLRFELAREGMQVRPLGGGRRSLWARWRYVDQQPFLTGDHFLAVQSLRLGKHQVGPLAANASVDRDVFRLDQLEMRLLGGQLTGQCAIEWDGADTRVLLRGNVTGLRLPNQPGRIDANAALELQPWRLAVQGRAQVLRLSKGHLLAALDLLDPYHEDLQANRARLALKLGYPEQMRLRFRHGFADVKVELGGLADLVRIDEIRGIALGPLMTRAVLPLLGDPPP